MDAHADGIGLIVEDKLGGEQLIIGPEPIAFWTLAFMYHSNLISIAGQDGLFLRRSFCSSCVRMASMFEGLRPGRCCAASVIRLRVTSMK
jgi:hypothetical protein